MVVGETRKGYIFKDKVLRPSMVKVESAVKNDSEITMSTPREKIIGIDLGTTNSAAAVLEAGRPVVIPSAEGPTAAGKMFPSVVAFTADGTLLVGRAGEEAGRRQPGGDRLRDKEEDGHRLHRSASRARSSPRSRSARSSSRRSRRTPRRSSGYPVKKAVITVPAHFNDNQRQATKDAGEIAGLEVVRIINEPTAACLAFGLDKTEKEMKVLVFSFGGGTHDVTVMEFGRRRLPGPRDQRRHPDRRSGHRLRDRQPPARRLQGEDGHRPEERQDRDGAAQGGRREGEDRALERDNDGHRPARSSPATATGAKNLHYTLTRAKLEELARPIVAKIEAPIKKVIQDAKLEVKDIEKVILIGGMTRMPLVRKTVEDVMGKPAERGVDPMEAVAIGAAIQGGVLAGEVKDILLLDVTPLSLGVETLGGIMTKVVDKNTTIPTKRTQIFSTAADFQTAVTIHVLQGERAMAV